METNKIKIYSDKKYLTKEEYEPILFPFWGLSPNIKENSFIAQFDDYIQNGQNYFEMTTIEDCDFAVYPEKYNKKNIGPFVDLAQQHNKPILIFFLDDSSEKIDINNSYIFRTSLYGNTRNVNEFAMPSWTENFTTKYFNGNLPVAGKKNKPTVSYCGYTKTWKDRIKDIIGKKYGVWRNIRYQAVKNLKKDNRIETNFIIRSDFWGGAYVSKNNFFSPQQLMNLQSKVREEYVENLARETYALTARGNGNFSMRFYEILSLGKIPLFINTDCVLPYEKFIDWKKLCVWVEESELVNISDILINFHNKINEQDIQKLQKEIYQTYYELLSPNGFFKNFYRHFK